jgi:hypothetical protein
MTGSFDDDGFAVLPALLWNAEPCGVAGRC